MDYSWIECIAKELERNSCRSHVHTVILQNSLDEIWNQERLKDGSMISQNFQCTDFYHPPTLLRHEETIDNHLGGKDACILLEKILHLGNKEFQQIFRQFCTGVLENIGDTERCSSFILRYKSLFSLLVIQEVVDRVYLSNNDEVYEDVLRCVFEIFAPDVCENEQLEAKLVNIFQENILMKGLLFFIVSCLSRTSHQKISYVQRCQEAPTELQMHIYERARFSSYEIDSLLDDLKTRNILSSCTSYPICLTSPCKKLFFFYKAFLERGLLASEKLSGNRSVEINQVVRKLIHECFAIQILGEYDGWKDVYNDYLLWQAEHKDTVSLASFETEIPVLGKVMDDRLKYENRLRRNPSDTVTWIDYMMWEFHTSHSLYLDIKSKGFSEEVAQSCLLRPLDVCEKALTSIQNINLGKVLLCSYMNPVSSCEEKKLAFKKTWKACASTLKHLFESDEILTTFQQCFKYQRNDSWMCNLSDCLPVWIQYISLVRLLFKRITKKGFLSGERNSFCTMLGHILPSLISRAIRCHPDSEELLSECTFLVYLYHKNYAKYWMPLENESFFIVPPFMMTKALISTKLLFMIFSNIDETVVREIDSVLSIPYHSFPILNLRGYEHVRQIKGPMHRRCMNLVVLFYLLGAQSQISGSLSTLYGKNSITKETNPSLLDMVLPKSVNETFTVLKNLIHMKKVKKRESDEIANSITCLMLALKKVLQEISSQSQYKCFNFEKSTSFLIEMTKSLTSIFDVSLNSYDTSFFLDVVDVLFQSHCDVHNEIGQIYRKATSQKSYQANKAYIKSRNRTYGNNENDFDRTVLSLYCAINKRLKWEHIHFFSRYNGSETSNNLPPERHDVSTIWQSVMQQSMEHIIGISDEARVSLQKTDIATWISLLGEYDIFIDIPLIVSGTAYICMRNIPTSLNSIESKRDVENSLSKEFLQHLQTWLAPFNPECFPKFCIQKKQIIVVAQFLTAKEAHQCTIAKNRKTWVQGKQGRTISVHHVISTQEFHTLCETLDRRKRHIYHENIIHQQESLDETRIQKTNKYFSELFSKGK